MFKREKYCKNNQALNHSCISKNMISSNKYNQRTYQKPKKNAKKINVIVSGRNNFHIIIGETKKMIILIQIIIIITKNFIMTIKKNLLDIKKKYPKMKMKMKILEKI